MAAAAEKLAALTREAVAAFDAGDTAKADTLFRKAASTREGGAQAAYNYAVFLRRTGSLDQAAYWIGRCLRAEPGRTAARIEYAMIALASDKPDEALAALDGVADEPEALLARATASFRLGDWAAASDTLGRMASPSPDATLLQIRCYAELNRIDEAESLGAHLGTANPSLKADILKALTRRARGRVSLDEARLRERIGGET